MVASTLRAGDAAVIGYNTGQTDGNGTTQDTLQFVILTAIGSGTVIRFTDRTWNGTAFSVGGSDGSFAFTAATDLAAGTVISITFTGGNANFFINGVAAGSVSAGGFDPEQNGDAIYVYQGTDANTPTTFLSAIEIGDGNSTFNGSLVNTGLVAGVTAVSTALDSATYSGPTTEAYAHLYNGERLLENIMDSTNWVGDDADGQKALDQPDHNGPYNVAPDFSLWLAGQGGGNALVHVGGDATVSSGNAGYNLTQLYTNLGAALPGARDIAFDTVEGKFFVADGTRILQGNISDLLGNPGTAPALTVLFTGTKPETVATQFGDNNIFNLQVDTVNNIIYFSHGSELSKIGYNTAGQTQTVLANLNAGNPTAGSNRNHIDDFEINFANGQVYLTSHRIVSGQDGDQLTKNYIYRITGLDAADGAGAFTFGNGSITFLPFAPDDDDSTNGFTWAPGEAFPQEEGTVEGVAISADGNTLYFTVASTLYDHDGDGGFVGDGNAATTDPILVMGGVFAYSLVGNPTGVYTQIWQQQDDGDTNSQTISTVFGPQGLLDDIEVDPVTGRLYFLDQTGDQLGATNPPGDEGVWSINPNGTGLAYFASVNNINSMGPSSIIINRAPTVSSSGSQATAVTEASNAPNSGATALVQPFLSLDVTDFETAGNASQQLAGATIWVSTNFQSGVTHQDTLTINGTTSGTVNGITYSYNSSTGAMTLTGITTFAAYEATIPLVRFNTSGDNVTNYGAATSRTISWAVSDGLNHSDPVSANVTVTGINDAPVNTIAAGGTIAEDSVTPAGVAVTGISVADVDADPASQNITVTLVAEHGILTIRTDVTGGLTAGMVTGNNTNTITITATQNQINATLGTTNATLAQNGLVLSSIPANLNGTIDITVTTNDGGFNGNDPGLTGNGTSEQDQDVKVITVTAVNDAPTVTDSTQTAATVTEDSPGAGETVLSLFGASFSDALDDQTANGGSSANSLAGIAVVANGSSAGVGQWQYFDGAAWQNIGTATTASAQFISAATLIRFTPAANYNGPAPSLTANLVDNSVAAPANGTDLNLSAGGATGGTTQYSTGTVVLSQANVVAVNDAPVASGSATLAAVNEDTAAPPGATVSSLFSGNFSDAADQVAGGSSANAFAGIAIVGNAATTQGTWQYFDGATWTDLPAVSAASAFLVEAADSLRFVPAANFNGTVPALTVRLVDDSAGALTTGATADLSAGGSTGGATPYSAGTVPLNSSINAVADEPTGTDNTVTVAEDGTYAFTAADFGFADVDGNSFAGVVITTLPAAGDVFLNNVAVSAGDFITAAQITGGLLTFKPDANDNGSGYTTFTFQVRDNSGATNTDSTPNTMTVDVSAVNDAPDITPDAPTDAAWTEGSGPTALLATGAVTDIDNVTNFAGGSLRVQITANAVAGDQITLLAASGFTVVAGELIYNGDAIGLVTGEGTSDFQIASLTADATPTVINALVKAFGFSNNTTTPTNASRTVTFTFNDGGNTGSGGSLSNATSQTVNVTDVVGGVAEDDSFSVSESGTITAANLFTNDTTPGSVIEVNGQAANVGTQITLTSGALLTVNADGTFSYDPNGAFDDLVDSAAGAGNSTDTDTFTYAVDGGDTALVTITINGETDSGDVYQGTAGNDTINGNNLGNIINGLAGDDTISGNSGGDVINGGDDNDSLSGNDGADKLNGDNGNDTLNGGEANDILTGGAGADDLVGGNGNDTLDGGADADDMNGGDGSDIYFVDDLGDTITDSSGVDTVKSTINYTLGAGLEHLTLLGSGDLNGTGNSSNNTINGNDGVNVLQGLDGADKLYGMGGKDNLDGGTGNDTLDGGDANDIVHGGIGNDTAVGGAGNDIVYGDDGNDQLDGGVGADKLFGGAGIDQLTGGIGNDYMYGGADTDTLTGGDGNDYLDGENGPDKMYGGAGNDVYIVNEYNDFISENANEGYDIVRSTSATYILGENIEALELTLGAGDIAGTGNSGANAITGNEGVNILDGKGGVDTIKGGDGNDVIFGGTGNDLLYGQNGWDIFAVRQESVGNSAAGGFVLETDRVFDLSFASGDRVDLSAIDANSTMGGNQAFHFASVLTTFSGAAGEATLTYDAATNSTYLRLDVNGDKKADYSLRMDGDHSGTSGQIIAPGTFLDGTGGWIL